MEIKPLPKEYTIDKKGQPVARTRTGREQLEVDSSLAAEDIASEKGILPEKVSFWEVLKRLAGKR